MCLARREWPQVRVEGLEDGPAGEANVGDLVGVRARLRLGALSPADVTVAAERFARLEADCAAAARALASWMCLARREWPQVRVEGLEDGPAGEANVGDLVGVRARLRLGALSPADVTVER